MAFLDTVIDIPPKDFVLTDHLLEYSLPKKRIGVLRGLSKKEMRSFIEDSFSQTGLYPFGLLPNLIKEGWIKGKYLSMYFRFDQETEILYGCIKKSRREIVICGYDLSGRERSFKLKELIQ